MAAVDVNMTGIVQVGNSVLRVRSRPSLAGSIIGRLKTGTKLTIIKQDGDWVYATNTGGWSHTKYITLTNNTQTNVNVVNIDKEQQAKLAAEEEARKKAAALESQLNAIEVELNTNSVSDNQIVDGLLVHNLNGVYGIPYQFMESVDPRLGNTIMGRKYSEKIISKMPLLYITPGKVEFMSNYSKAEQEGLLGTLLSNNTETDISNIIKNNGRYYTFTFADVDYFDYVNGLCRAGARFLGIQDVKIKVGGTEDKAKNFNWRYALNKNLKATFTDYKFIGFYVDSVDSVSESFSNDTTQSQLSSTVNGFSDTAREVGFLLGAGAGKQVQMFDEDKRTQVMSTIDNISKKYLSGSTLLQNIASDFSTISVGGKLLFPEIWSDSSFSRNFDINLKLRTPDGDILSWYLNIYVPLCHLIALAAGHQTENANGYYSPFLIRAFYKGLFNIDMGIVTDMTISKGKEAAWTVDGLPTEVDITLTIKDLYNMLSIVPGDEPKNFVSNNILMDYIANTCGININQMDIGRSLEIYYILTKNKITDLPSKILRRMATTIDAYAMNAYNNVLNKYLI